MRLAWERGRVWPPRGGSDRNGEAAAYLDVIAGVRRGDRRNKLAYAPGILNPVGYLDCPRSLYEVGVQFRPYLRRRKHFDRRRTCGDFAPCGAGWRPCRDNAAISRRSRRSVDARIRDCAPVGRVHGPGQGASRGRTRCIKRAECSRGSRGHSNRRRIYRQTNRGRPGIGESAAGRCKSTTGETQNHQGKGDKDSVREYHRLYSRSPNKTPALSWGDATPRLNYDSAPHSFQQSLEAQELKRHLYFPRLASA